MDQRLAVVSGAARGPLREYLETGKLTRAGFPGGLKPELDESHEVERYGKSLFPEGRARTVWTVLEHRGPHETQIAAIAVIAPKIGGIPLTLGVWLRQTKEEQGAA